MSKEIKLYENKITMRIPDDFVAAQAAEKLTGGVQPDYLYADEKKIALITVTWGESELPEDIDKRIMEYREMHRRAVPNFGNCTAAKKKTKSGKDIAAILYTSTTPTRDLHNFFVLTGLQGRELTITIHCDIKDIPYYGMQLMDIVDSIDVAE